MKRGLILAKKASKKRASPKKRVKKQVKKSPTRLRPEYHGHLKTVLVVLAVLTLVLIVATISNRGSLGGKTAALVNGEKILQSDLDTQYDRLPDQFKDTITKDVLLEQMINEQILIQEAKKITIGHPSGTISRPGRQSPFL